MAYYRKYNEDAGSVSYWSNFSKIFRSIKLWGIKLRCCIYKPFSIICELGLTITIVNEIVKADVSESTLVGTAIVMRIFTGVLSMIALLILTFIIDGNDYVIRGVVVIRAVGLIFDSCNTINYWYQSKLQSKYATMYELFAYIISSVYKVIILILHKDIFWFAAATTIDSIFIAIFYLIGFKSIVKIN